MQVDNPPISCQKDEEYREDRVSPTGESSFLTQFLEDKGTCESLSSFMTAVRRPLHTDHAAHPCIYIYIFFLFLGFLLVLAMFRYVSIVHPRARASYRKWTWTNESKQMQWVVLEGCHRGPWSCTTSAAPPAAETVLQQR